MCILFFQHISIRNNHVSGTQWPHVVSGYFTDNPLSRNPGWREFIYSEKALVTLLSRDILEFREKTEK